MKFIRKLLLVAIILTILLIQFLLSFYTSAPHSSSVLQSELCANGARMHSALTLNASGGRIGQEIADSVTDVPSGHSEAMKPLSPSFMVSKHRKNVSVVIGIPSVKRNQTNYLLDTVNSLLGVMSDDEKRQVLVVILLSDLNPRTVEARYGELSAAFSSEINSGLIDVIAPPPSFYPDLDHLKSTLDDPPDRMKWRTKQVLDFAYIMTYAMNRGTYFLQLEDDVIGASQFVTKIINFAEKQEAANPDWIYLQYAELGYIGKLFRNRDLQSLITFYVMFHTTKPVDWLLRHYVTVKVCPYDDPWVASPQCLKYFQKAIVNHPKSLFQHVGLFSSLDGKKQPLKETKFDQDVVPVRPDIALIHNPAASLSTSLKNHQSNTLDVLYQGTGIMWALNPVLGDYIHVDLKPPIALSKFLVISGLSTAPLDILEKASFEVAPEIVPASLKPNGTYSNFFNLAWFDARGQATGLISSSFGKIRSVRVNVFKNQTHWAAISVFQLYP